MTEDDLRRIVRAEQDSARLGHAIASWQQKPNLFRSDVSTYVGTCQNAGCICLATVELTPAGWAIGGGYLTGQKCPIVE